ncbi:glioma pathogenesis-related protein 1 isoform X2 [Clinocottus analis]|uniref:glioma pathogenesis-related protein 1 isoform X2 n=1 Tax=Clinocottus analis TaxID=304258 RepID=UPI0035BF8AB9
MSAVWTLLWAWTLLDSGHCSASLPDISDGAFMKECVQAHNGARSSVSPPASNMLYMVVWASSYKVGCAAQLCPGQAIFVCNYGPAGNRNRRVPYQPGPGCSGCDGRCEEKLCRSQERDSQKSYNWSPDWDPVLEPRFSYLPILVSRPVALILTFIAAYAVRYFYPDVFCYE